jgi:hypothetical protein
MVFSEAKNINAKINKIRAAITRQGTAPCRRAADTFSRLVFLEIFFEAIQLGLAGRLLAAGPEQTHISAQSSGAYSCSTSTGRLPGAAFNPIGNNLLQPL